VNGLARAGGGQPEYVHPGEIVSEKALRQLYRASDTENLEINTIIWDIPTKIVTPKEFPTIFAGQRVIIYGLLERNFGDKFPKILFENGKQISILESDVQRVQGDTVHKLMARSRIRDLEEGEGESTKEEITQLGVTYNLMSSQTSFLAVDNEIIQDYGNIIRQHVPQQISYGEMLNSQFDSLASMFIARPSSNAMASFRQLNNLAMEAEDEEGNVDERDDFIATPQYELVHEAEGEDFDAKKKERKNNKFSYSLIKTLDINLGIEFPHGKFMKIIPSHSSLPALRQVIVSTTEDNQASLLIKVFKCQYEGEDIDNCDHIGQLILDNLPPAPKNTLEIKVSIFVYADERSHTAKVTLILGEYNVEVTDYFFL